MIPVFDLGCSQGGVTKGLQRAGFFVVGVDLRVPDNYPGDDFIEMDAEAFVKAHASLFRAGVGSPPCQRYTHGNAGREAANRHPDLIGPWRQALQDAGLPYVLENVPRAPLHNPITLCGTQFRLQTRDDDGVMLHLQRHRQFEANWPLEAPAVHHHPQGVQWAGAYGGARRDKTEARTIRHGGYVPPRPVLDRLMGIDWMDEAGLFQAIPPAYTEFIGRQLWQVL